MRAQEIMSSPAVTVHRSTPIDAVADTLSQTGFCALPVVDSGQRLVGIITDHDVRQGLIDSPQNAVSDVMTTTVVSVGPRTDLSELVATVLEKHVPSVPVVEHTRVVGVITRRDLVHTVANDESPLTREVHRRLERYGGRGRWTVSVHNGVASIADALDDPTDRHVARVLAESVPGVHRAQVAPRDVR